MDNSRVINLGLEDDNNSIQQEVDVTIPDSVDDRSGINQRSNKKQKLPSQNIERVNLKVTIPGKNKLNNDLKTIQSSSKTALQNKGIGQGVLRNN